LPGVRIGGKARGVSRVLSELRALTRLALPLASAALAQSMIYVTDTIMVGKLGAQALAASTIAINLYLPVLFFGWGLAACAPLIAEARGGGIDIAARTQSIRKTIGATIWLMGGFAVAATLALVAASGAVTLFAPAAAVGEDARAFMHVLTLGLFPALVGAALRSATGALDRPAMVLAITLGAVAANIVLNIALIHGSPLTPRLGLIGSAWASTIANVGTALAYLAVIAFDRHLRPLRLLAGIGSVDWARLRALARLGLPIAAMMVAEVAVFNLGALIIGRFGVNALAGHAIAIQLASLPFVVVTGVGQAATIRVGLAYGERAMAQARFRGLIAIGLGMAVMLGSMTAMWSIPGVLVAPFIGVTRPDAAAVSAHAIHFLGFAALFQLFDGGQAVAAAVLRGVQDTRAPLLIALIGYWPIAVGCGTVAAFVTGAGADGIWLGFVAGLAFVAVALCRRVLRIA
jgi:MATE family multidrug resistance protein